VSTAQWVAIAAIGVPALALVLWPLLRARSGQAPAVASGPDRRLELAEEKAAAYHALKELQFDHESGSLSDDDFEALRDRYESRAGQVLAELDALGGAAPTRAAQPAAPRPWTRSPAAMVAGGLSLLALGIGLGVGVGRYAQPDDTMIPPGSRLPVPASPDPGPLLQGQGGEPMKPVPPEILAGMLRAARQSLMEGRYPEAIAAYQAVLKRDQKNVDAMTHLALIVAIGGHADAALETFDKALTIDPRYAPAFLYRGQVLYEVKQDYAGAIKAWERFLTLTPSGEDRDRVTALIKEARGKTAGK